MIVVTKGWYAGAPENDDVRTVFLNLFFARLVLNEFLELFQAAGHGRAGNTQKLGGLGDAIFHQQAVGLP